MSLDPETQAEERRIETLSEELGDAIAALPEYERFLEAKEAVTADEEAQERIAEFEKRREEYMAARQRGEATNEDLLELQSAQEDLHDIPVMSEFLRAKNDLELRLQAVNERISDPLAIDFGETAGGCCQD
ncbi:regulator [Halobacteriales archaeon QH_2_65_14]|nr:MAG: regulator [Halobacteriales archaeon QH_2_65_14]